MQHAQPPSATLSRWRVSPSLGGYKIIKACRSKLRGNRESPNLPVIPSANFKFHPLAQSYQHHCTYDGLHFPTRTSSTSHDVPLRTGTTASPMVGPGDSSPSSTSSSNPPSSPPVPRTPSSSPLRLSPSSTPSCPPRTGTTSRPISTATTATFRCTVADDIQVLRRHTDSFPALAVRMNWFSRSRRLVLWFRSKTSLHTGLPTYLRFKKWNPPPSK
ncbi:hypothetical protein QBC39DRAFT_15464 [Podospora conica]|nr:hypothetical protein QBC39DRAFT_15464 [Schizothecium conicum]